MMRHDEELQAIVDIDISSQLGLPVRYVKPISQNGVMIQCIEESNIESEVIFWKSSLICFVLVSNPPYHVIDVFLRRIWGRNGLDRFLVNLMVCLLFAFTQNWTVMMP